MSNRTYDIVVFGATGFTGRLVAEYLAANAPPKLRWALAGRDAAKLEELRASLKGPSAPQGVVAASIGDAEALAKMARSTSVVLTTVGPYVEYGEPVVRACVAEGADYVDITGEPEFVEAMIEKYDDEARAKKVRIVNCCGFDSIPHDLGVFFTMKQLPENTPARVEGFVRGQGTFSGGTWQSAVRAMGNFRAFSCEQARRRAARGASKDARRVGGTAGKLRYVRELGSWACPLPTIDPQIVLRSARAIDGYGPDFKYGHFARIKHLSTLAFGMAGVGAVFSLAQLKPTRELLLKVKKSGDGPTAAQRAKSSFQVTFLGEAGGKHVMTQVSGGDPGYGETSKMISESALALALDRDRLPPVFGVTTTAASIGDVLLERLQRAGISFAVVSAA